MNEWEDYYEILGVSPHASAEEVNQAYRYKVNIFHPDRLAGVSERIRRQAEEDLKRVNRAYNVLRDPSRRREYHSEWVKRKGGGRETPRTKSASPGPARTKDKAASFSIESLSDAEANRLLRKFAKFRSLVILPFGFLRDARIVEAKRVHCCKEHMTRWRIDEQVQRCENLPYSKYASYRRDYADRRKHISYDRRTSLVGEYIVPGTEAEHSCTQCHGEGSTKCETCHGRGRVTCFMCEGAGQALEREECPRCLGEGRTDTTERRRTHMPSGRIYEEQIEVEADCFVCHGLGYRERLARCHFCGGTGDEVCDACHGSGVTRCRLCEGRGKTYGATVCTFQTAFEFTKPVWSTGPVPEKHLKAADRGFRREEDLSPPADDIARIQRLRWSVPVAYVNYTFAGKTYVLCEVGYGLKGVRGKLKFDSYPRSLQKLAVFVGGTLLVAAAIVAVAVLVQV